MRHRRRRLLTHGIVFAGAALAVTTLGPSATSAAPTVQDGRFLQGGAVDVTYSCTGNDPDTTDLLTTFGLNPFPMDVTVRSAAVEPAPSPGEDFTGEFFWDFDLDPEIVSFAVGLTVTTFTITNGVNPVAATTGADGTAAGTGAAAAVVELGDGSVPVGFTVGPYAGTFNRTAAVDSPIVFTPGTITSTVTTSSNVALNIRCTSGGGAITVLDETGVAPTTTTTTRPSVVVPTTAPPTATTAAVAAGGGGEPLPATGTSSTLYLVLLGLGLIDVGYLALTAGESKRRTSSAR